MSPSPVITPGTANLTQALEVLRSTSHREAIFKGSCSFWLGSRISSARFDNIDVLLTKLLENLQTHCSAERDCPFRVTINRILNLTSLRYQDRDAIDLSTPARSWPKFAEIITQLQNQYSTVLGIAVRIDGVNHSIPWEILKLQQVYSDPTKEPDAEHILLALLIEEQYLFKLVSANWDPLIEKAYEGCFDSGTNQLEVIACNEDLNRKGSGRAPRLFKVHGCAQKAANDPNRYLPYMLATKAEIAQWTEGAERKAFRDAARMILREGPALFIGLSGQDFNLQALFVGVREKADEPYPPVPARVAFCADGLSEDHHTILENLYGKAAYNAHTDEITREAALPLYAKPLLATLYALGLKEKIVGLLQAATSELQPAHLTFALESLNKTEDRICAFYDAMPEPDERWRSLCDHFSRFVTRLLGIYRHQQLPTRTTAYEPLSAYNLAEIPTQSLHALGHQHWLFLMLACLLEGEERGYWKLEVPLTDSATSGQLIIWQNEEPLRVFLLHSPARRSRLEKVVLDTDTSPRALLLLYPSELVPREAKRFPLRELPGSKEEDNVTEISLQDLLEGAPTGEDLLDAVRDELLGARREW
jgi:hypothetical protein